MKSIRTKFHTNKANDVLLRYCSGCNMYRLPEYYIKNQISTCIMFTVSLLPYMYIK